MYTGRQLGKIDVSLMLAAGALVIAAIGIGVIGGRRADAEREGHIESSESGEFLITPGNRTRIYKYYDEVGALCFVAESTDGQAVAMHCMEHKE